MIVQGHNASFGGDAKTLIKRHITGIREIRVIVFGLVAGCTSVQQVDVFKLRFRIAACWDEMINMEGRAARAPFVPSGGNRRNGK